ncbi:hypothetical protein FOZ63_015327, partial [Perkinsus olseni]
MLKMILTGDYSKDKGFWYYTGNQCGKKNNNRRLMRERSEEMTKAYSSGGEAEELGVAQFCPMEASRDIPAVKLGVEALARFPIGFADPALRWQLASIAWPVIVSEVVWLFAQGTVEATDAARGLTKELVDTVDVTLRSDAVEFARVGSIADIKDHTGD